MSKRLTLGLLCALFVDCTASGICRASAAQNQPSTDSAATVRETTEEFLRAFVNLDWERFRSFFAADATVFFPPSANSPERSNNKLEVEAVFKTVFDNARKQKSNPPFLKIQPRDMRVQMLGDVAIVTFHLDDPDSTGRRTIVLRRQGRRWLIVHLHASGISVKESHT